MGLIADALLVAAIPIGGAVIGAGAAYGVLALVALRRRRKARAMLLALAGRPEGQPVASSIWSRGEVWLPGLMMNAPMRRRLDLAHKMGLDVAVDLYNRRQAQWFLAGDEELPDGHGWFIVREKDHG